MADAGRGGFGARGGDRAKRAGGRGRGRGRGRRGGRSDEKEWQPVTKLGRLVKAGKIKSMEEIYLHSLPVKEYQIIDAFLPKLKDEVMKVSAFEGGGGGVITMICGACDMAGFLLAPLALLFPSLSVVAPPN